MMEYMTTIARQLQAGLLAGGRAMAEAFGRGRLWLQERLLDPWGLWLRQAFRAPWMPRLREAFRDRCMPRLRKAFREHRALWREGTRWAAIAALVALLGAASYGARQRLAKEDRWAARQASVLQSAPAAPAPTPSLTPEPMRWLWPVAGEVVGPYSPDAPVWSRTLGQWQTHEGIDIAASPGEAVYACGDGVVADAYRDRLWGNVIVIDHGDGRTSTYAALNTLELVSVGDAVKGGDIISAIGRSADCEADLGWHLHFAMTKDGAPVDFSALCDQDLFPGE